MAATLVATVGATDANTYTTAAEFATWAAERQVSTAYDDADSDERIRAQISATRRLDQERYKGVRVNDTQALQWPRYGVEKPDLAYSVLSGAVFTESTWYLTTEIPALLKRAQMELAYQILADNASPDDTGLEGFKRMRAGSVEIEPNHARRAGTLPESVRREIKDLVRAGSDGIRLVRG